MTVDDAHGTLPGHADRLVAHLDSLQSRLRHGRAEHMWHREFAERCALLADQLHSARLLTERGHYAAAFVVVRAALEHHLIDRLLFLATRYLQVYSVRKEDVAGEESRLAELRAGPRPDIARWSMRNGRMNVIVRGLYMDGRIGRPPMLSPYYAVVDQYDPFTGKSAHQARLAGEFLPVGLRRRAADEADSVWRSLFTWPKLLRNLRLNALVTIAQELQLDVHYSFLSAYTHPMGRAYDLVYGPTWNRRPGSYNHFASELVLLYVLVLASEELTAFGRMSRRRPRVGLAGWDGVTRDVADAKRDGSYAWFLIGEPQPYDWIAEAHTRLARRREPWRATISDPSVIRSAGVKYYVNPLERLTRLHDSFREMTSGLVHQSPFQRGGPSV